ncbi:MULTISPECIES: mycofactocin precursor MftA [Microbacterium]|jgi:mycofactocin precursor|nr:MULTISPECIES: mycofactocin precursor MftA [Microbacterium]MDO8383059.1 mycofactocin precursor MftA [Microbacterium sp.]|tara:strand:- start:867 stop:986 length:120 start_codon:yes stop_codon:yes gene_type:complete
MDPQIVKPATSTEAVAADSPVESDSLVEEVSIDGMCGVY